LRTALKYREMRVLVLNTTALNNRDPSPSLCSTYWIPPLVLFRALRNIALRFEKDFFRKSPSLSISRSNAQAVALASLIGCAAPRS